jgi:hypothetical protein
MAIFSEPVTALQIFSLSGLGLIGLAAVPPIRKSKRLKQVLVLGIVVLAVFSIGYFVGLTAAQTGTITIEPASFQTEASYIVFTDGTTIKARNGKTGAIDFSGSDASTVIQSAINALTNGGKIFIKSGTYQLSTRLTLISNLSLEGEDKYTTILFMLPNQPASTHMLFAASKENIEIKNLQFDSNQANQPNSPQYIISFSEVTNVTVDNCILKNAKSIGICLDTQTATNVMKNIIKNVIVIGPTGGDGFYLAGTGITVSDCQFYNLGENAIGLNRARKVTLENIIVNSATGDGISIGNDSEDITINNFVLISTKRGIRAWMSTGTYSAYRVMISNGIIYQPIEDGIRIDNPANNWQIENVYIYGAGAGGTFGDGIYIKYGTNFVLNALHIENCRQNGICVSYTTPTTSNSIISASIIFNNNQGGLATGSGINLVNAQRIRISNNRIYDNQATKTQRYAIILQTGCDYEEIVNNYLESGSAGVIYITGANNIIQRNIGYDTENFKATGKSVAVGTGGAYGSATAITTLSGRVTYPRVKITWGGTFGTGETVTVKVEAVYSDGSTAYVEKSATATGSLWLTDDDILALITQGKDIVKLNVYAKTNLSSTTVTVTVDAYGKA